MIWAHRFSFLCILQESVLLCAEEPGEECPSENELNRKLESTEVSVHGHRA